MNRKILLLMFLVLAGSIFGQGVGSKWFTNIEEASIVAAKENKKILLFFSGSDWCVPCIELKKKVFKSKEFLEKVQDRFVFVNIDFPQERKSISQKEIIYREKCAEKFNKNGLFPLVILLDSSLNVFKKIDGYKGEDSSYYIKNYLE